MKKLFVIAILALTALTAPISSSAQEKLIITPGIGYPDISIGMSNNEVNAVLGEPSEVKSYSDEKQSWEDFGYDTEKEMVFLFRFEKVVVYEDNKYGIWKGFYRDGKLVCMNIAAWGLEPEVTANISLLEKVNFWMSLDEVTKALGKKYKSVVSGKVTYLWFFKTGLHLIIDEEGLTNIYIFNSGILSKKDQKIVVSAKKEMNKEK